MFVQTQGTAIEQVRAATKDNTSRGSDRVGGKREGGTPRFVAARRSRSSYLQEQERANIREEQGKHYYYVDPYLSFLIF